MTSNNDKQFTKALNALPDNVLRGIYQSCVSEGGIAPVEDTSRQSIIQYLVFNHNNLFLKEPSSHPTITPRFVKAHQENSLLMKICMDLIQQKGKYNLNTLKILCRAIYNIDGETEDIIFKDCFIVNLQKFLDWMNEDINSKEDAILNSIKIQDKFKELCISVMDFTVLRDICSHFINLAITHGNHTGLPGLKDIVNKCPLETVIVQGICSLGPESDLTLEKIYPTIPDEDFDDIPDIEIVDSQPQPTPQPAPEPAPEPQPQPTPQLPANLNPVWTSGNDVVICKTLAEKEQIYTGVGTLMNPGSYKQLDKSMVNKSSWNKLRKTHQLVGRWDIYICLDEVNGDNPMLNTNLKYKTPQMCLPGLEGSNYCELNGHHICNHPHGTIYLVPWHLDIVD